MRSDAYEVTQLLQARVREYEQKANEVVRVASLHPVTYWHSMRLLNEALRSLRTAAVLDKAASVLAQEE